MCVTTITTRPASASCAQHHHDLVVQRRVQTRGRLVEDQQRRPGQQFQRHRGALALPAGQLVHPGVGVFGQIEFFEHLSDDAGPGRLCWCRAAAAVPRRSPAPSSRSAGGAPRRPAEPSRSCCAKTRIRRGCRGPRRSPSRSWAGHSRRSAGPAWSFRHPDPPMMAVNVPGLATSEMSLSSCLPLSTEYLTSRTSRPPVRVASLAAGDQGAVAEHQVGVADGDHVAVGQDRRPDPGPVDERPVDAAVADLGADRREHQRRVLTRGQHVGDDDVVLVGAADGDGSLGPVAFAGAASRTVAATGTSPSWSRGWTRRPAWRRSPRTRRTVPAPAGTSSRRTVS